ncbi:MAG: PilZ domain-containing protein [Proteobacteria bacterium]|nr:PilZ domain-containing protein [Pseudomonadota bacterium]
MVEERRKEVRKIVDSLNLPFIGSKDEDHLCFEYLLIDLSKNGLKIAIPRWVVNREQIKKGDIINFHLPYEIDKTFYDQGKVVWIEWDENMEIQSCGISVESIKSISYPYALPVTQKGNTLINLIKDMVLLKKGVYVYLCHLIPYFSKITEYSPQEYPQLKAFFLDNVRNKVSKHHVELENTLIKIENYMTSESDIPKFIDLARLRSIVESEIYVEIFRINFSDERIIPYLNAIKKLEERLYFNYNIIVMLYVNSL